MKVFAEVEIAQPKEQVWQAITDIDNCQQMLSGIIDLKVLHRPTDGLVGLKWQETRVMFGKQASETMWITDATENKFYRTRAENHGAIYITEMSIAEAATGSVLSMTFSITADSLIMKLMSACMGVFMDKSMRRMLKNELDQIRSYLEAR